MPSNGTGSDGSLASVLTILVGICEGNSGLLIGSCVKSFFSKGFLKIVSWLVSGLRWNWMIVGGMYVLNDIVKARFESPTEYIIDVILPYKTRLPFPRLLQILLQLCNEADIWPKDSALYLRALSYYHRHCDSLLYCR